MDGFSNCQCMLPYTKKVEPIRFFPYIDQYYNFCSFFIIVENDGHDFLYHIITVFLISMLWQIQSCILARVSFILTIAGRYTNPSISLLYHADTVIQKGWNQMIENCWYLLATFVHAGGWLYNLYITIYNVSRNLKQMSGLRGLSSKYSCISV